MEEADLLKERLQAITDKRKLQEDIARKKAEIEQEKLKFQYLKKKSLREQWLMDGLSPQSEQDQEAMKLQAQDELQQTRLLQSNILRMEKEIEALESQEMTISNNEMLILKRLKEVEKTAEDIIKEVNAGVNQAIPDIPKSYKPSQLKKMSRPVFKYETEESKEALFAMEINVQKDMKTGESQVLSTATVASHELPQKGVKVYDDGRKSVYAMQNGVGELSPLEVEELLRKATEGRPLPEVEYHEPVFASPYSRPSTPRRQLQDRISPRPGIRQDSFNTVISHPELTDGELLPLEGEAGKAASHLPIGHIQQPHPERSRNTTNSNGSDCDQVLLDGEIHLDDNTFSQVPDLQWSCEGDDATPPVGSSLHHRDPLLTCSENLKINFQNTVPETLDSCKPVTMVFMGYCNADEEQEAQGGLGDDGVIQAELVVIKDHDDDDHDDSLSYHPDGCHSKVFQPKMNMSSKANLHLTKGRPSYSTNNALTQEPQCMFSQDQQMSQLFKQTNSHGSEDPSIAVLRMRMAKLGKRV